MKVLHLFRSPSDQFTEELIAKAFADHQNDRYLLYVEQVDYEELLKRILESDKVICWW